MFNQILKLALENKRPPSSKAIQDLCEAIMALSDSSHQDAIGNVWIDLRQGGSTTCFMAHLDTVHREEGPNPVVWTSKVASTGGLSVLGADDGAGVALLAGLISLKIPALYLFSQGEESGGHGAQFVVENFADIFTNISRIISFDRRGKFDICGEQWCGPCASREFVAELGVRLGMGHMWACGTYTDNSEFRYLVPEIVNISVGYEHCHKPTESLDLEYLHSLFQKCATLDWESLGVYRSCDLPTHLK